MAKKPPKQYEYSLQAFTPSQEEVLRRFERLPREEREYAIVVALRWCVWFFTGRDVGRQEPPQKPEQ